MKFFLFFFFFFTLENQFNLSPASVERFSLSLCFFSPILVNITLLFEHDARSMWKKKKFSSHVIFVFTKFRRTHWNKKSWWQTKISRRKFNIRTYFSYASFFRLKRLPKKNRSFQIAVFVSFLFSLSFF